MSRRCLLRLFVLHVAAACYEVNLTSKTPLPTSGGADGVEAMVGIRPEGDWGALFQLEREDRVVAKINISHRESKTGNKTAYNDHLAIQCGDKTPQPFDSPWPTAWLSGEVKCLLFRVSDNLIHVLQKEGSSESHIGSDMCKVNLSNISFSASNLPHLPAPMLSPGCADGELNNGTKAKSEDQQTERPLLYVTGFLILLALVLSTVIIFMIL
ncbi:uncharacterized protein LOC119595736 [Penaeus monodon]|uniref:uncharacterized protein LOC119595736 n=1 Tax=Penaeus monodon TaxID=6687 RepID=UPI0018A74492|nr:uncharacterized protein LOC119595736 [Penaeus monodon]